MTRQKRLMDGELHSLTKMFTAEEFHDRIRRHDPRIGLATVYRHLATLVKDGVLHAYTCDRRTVYSRTGTSHCHFVCERTGEITHFHVDDLDFLKGKLPGSVTSFQIEVRGVCGDCRIGERVAPQRSGRRIK